MGIISVGFVGFLRSVKFALCSFVLLLASSQPASAHQFESERYLVIERVSDDVLYLFVRLRLPKETGLLATGTRDATAWRQALRPWAEQALRDVAVYDAAGEALCSLALNPLAAPGEPPEQLAVLCECDVRGVVSIVVGAKLKTHVALSPANRGVCVGDFRKDSRAAWTDFWSWPQ